MRKLSAVLAVLGFVIAAVVLAQAISENRRRFELERATQQLTHVSGLLSMMLAAVKSRIGGKKPPLVCAALAAGAYRLAEARDLRIDKPDAVALVLMERDLVLELDKAGFDVRSAYGGLSSRIFASSNSPHATFDSTLAGCVNGGP